MSLPASIRDHLTLPAIAAPMFLCSGVALAVAVCRAGLVGSLTRNHCRDMAELETQLAAVHDALCRARGEQPGTVVGPLAVNISPRLEPREMRAHLELCRRYGAGIVIPSVGDPTSVRRMIGDAGLLHFHDATSIRFADKAVAAGVDGIVAIGAGGGGHAGTVSHLALIPQIRAMFDGTLVMAGAVSTGAVIRAAEVLGADLAYLGTRFIATRESMAPDAYKAMIVAGGPADVLYTGAVNGHPASWLMASLRQAGLDPADLPVPGSGDAGHLPEGVRPWRDVWSAGQGIGLIQDVPSVAELVVRLRAEYEAACAVPPLGRPA